jgi:hypothetical protein
MRHNLRAARSQENKRDLKYRCPITTAPLNWASTIQRHVPTSFQRHDYWAPMSTQRRCKTALFFRVLLWIISAQECSITCRFNSAPVHLSPQTPKAWRISSVSLYVYSSRTSELLKSHSISPSNISLSYYDFISFKRIQYITILSHHMFSN